ncbi:hypothetical protein DVA76_20210, partial [Acinetobacter baumannii]
TLLSYHIQYQHHYYFPLKLLIRNFECPDKAGANNKTIQSKTLTSLKDERWCSAFDPKLAGLLSELELGLGSVVRQS